MKSKTTGNVTNLVPQTGVPPNYTQRSREIIYDGLRKNVKFVLNPFGPQKLYLSRPEHHW